MNLSYLHGKPACHGVIRSCPEDFQVVEQMKVEPDGQGEHLWLWIRKRNTNTEFLARQLAKQLGVAARNVSYAGLKDRNAVTEQWFSIHLPGKPDPAPGSLNSEDWFVLRQERHSQKLRPQAMQGNRFILTLRDLTDKAAFEHAWQAVTATGVPNYFGEQRFGINGGNLDAARAMFGGKKIKDRHKRGLYLSAARSLIFNDVVSERIKQGLHQQVLTGDVVMLSGSQSCFTADTVDSETTQRLCEGDIGLTAPMTGANGMQPTAAAADFETAVLEAHADFIAGLQQAGLKNERRRLLLHIQQPELCWLADDVAQISFGLPTGSFATSVLRELCQYDVAVGEPV